ncbi:FecCD family ABC transporter permease [Brevibacterium otitidis]|uniref:FecCD family ABC transporter permease n=1 Tax=Brevibacterium otitidis TaxID=53364 RepID=A0ABV5X5J0_9MICO|nr:iron ABC transporter permease [Brevibacterium otitidis]
MTAPSCIPAGTSGTGTAAPAAASAPAALRRRRLRLTLITATAAVCVLLAAAASVAFGSQPLPLNQVLTVLREPAAAGPDAAAVVWGLRIPRTIVGLIAGAALGLAGALAQVHTRNPLADPGLLGVTSGAGFAVIAGMAFFGLDAPLQYVWCALVGAVLSGALVLLIAGRIRAFGPITTIVLTGAITSALLGAASTAIVLTHEEIMRSFQGWSTGALVNRQLDLLPAVAPLLAAGIVLTLVNLPAWPGLALGDELAAGLGRNVAADRTIGISAIVVLAAAATAITGPLAFIGLLSPHAARRLVPDAPIAAVLLTAPVGAILLLTADVLGRVAVAHGELPVGVAIALIGAPVFVVIARAVTR